MGYYSLLLVVPLLAALSAFSWHILSIRISLTPRFNPWTQKLSSSSLYNESSYNCTTCSWNTYKENSEYTSVPELSLFNDEAIQQEDPLIKCLPESFGYTDEEANNLFPYTFFPECASFLPSSAAQMFIDIDSNLLTMNCTDGEGKFVTGEPADSEVLGLMTFDKGFESYSKPYKLHKEEYAYSTCYDKSKFLEDVEYHHRPKQELLDKKPQNDTIKIISLTLDSVSRRNFFRKMPKTVEFINNQMNKKFKAFDMKIHNVMGEFSANNLMPQLLGDTHYKMMWEMVDEDVHYQDSIWKVANDNEFATLFVEEGCTNDLARYFGKNVHMDHIATSFWCAARRFNDFENNSQKQRCIGRKNSHVYVYDYITEFSRNYKHLSQWAFAHINTAHENTGLLISTMDLDTVKFLEKYLDENADSKTILIITGDHGMRYGEWFKKLDGSHEHRLPLGLILASDSLLNSIPNSIDALLHNSNRLTSKLDLFTTQLHLINSLHSEIFLSSQIYQEIKEKTSKRYKTVSLLLEKVPNNRTCFDIGIPAFWCSCLKFVEVEDEAPKFVVELAQIVVNAINDEAYKPLLSPLGQYCQKLTFDKIDKLWVLSTDEEYYKMQITVNESETAMFEAVVLLTWKSYRARADAYPQEPHFDYGKRAVNIMYIRRVDSYAGKCETIARDNNIRPETCICRKELLE